MASAGRTSSSGASSCRVVARFRPLAAREAGARCVAFDAAAEAQVSVLAAGAEAVPFAFDAVLRESATQDDIFDRVARETVDRVQQGFNGAILAYGQSGSGKTFTMGSSPAATPATRGLIPRIATQLLADGADVLTLSLVEVYKERIRCVAALRRVRRAGRACILGQQPLLALNEPPRLTGLAGRSDLLCPSRDNLQLHEGPRGTFVGNATEARGWAARVAMPL